MKKKPEDMKLHDALDLFEENKSEIKFFGPKLRCNLQEQIGNIMINNNLFSPETDEAKLLAAQLQKAAELIRPYLVSEEKRKELQKVLDERAHYKKELMERMAAERRTAADNLGRAKDSQRQNSRTDNGARTREGQRQSQGANNGAKPREEQKPKQGTNNGTRPREEQRPKQGTNNGARPREEQRQNQDNKAKPVKKITYTRKAKVTGEGNTVTIVEISENQKDVEIPLPSGEKMSLIPPYINSRYIEQCQQRFGVKVDIKKYLIMEMSPDKKVLFVNVVYGELNLDLMHQRPEYLDLYMQTILDKKRINEICRNNFCVLDRIVPTGPKNYNIMRDEIVDWIVGRSILENSEEIRTTRPTMSGLFGIFSKQPQNPEENVLRFHKTGVMIIGGKQCLVYSYATKDQTTSKEPEVGSFIVSGLDEKRFKTDVEYRNAVMSNVITPTRLMNSRRADIPYPYIGEVTPEGGFVNNFDIYNALNNRQIQI